MTARESGTVNALVERQMRNWEIARSQAPAAAEPVDRPVKPFVTISRMVGSGGSEVAAQLAEKVGWPLFDREVLKSMAGDNAVRARLYETMDERDIGFIEDVLRSFTGSEFKRNDYFHRLSETILAVARQGSAIFLGRGADLILPRHVGIRLRIVALPAICAERFARRHGIDSIRAAREIERIEQDRARFLRSHFSSDLDSPDRHDLFFNIAAISVAEAVEIVVHLMRLRGMVH